MFVVYGDVRSRRRSEELLRVVEAWAARLGNAPVFIGGDFNMETEESEVMRRWEVSGVLRDVHHSLALACGRGPAATTTSGRRIDHAWANPEGLRLVRSCRVIEDQFATHHSLAMELDLDAFVQKSYVRYRPPE